MREARKDSYESDFQNEFETPRFEIINEKNLTARTANNKARYSIQKANPVSLNSQLASFHKQIA